MISASMMLGALLIDAAAGWPKQLHAKIGHPVSWMGEAISVLEEMLNGGARQRRLVMGAVTTLIIVAAAYWPAWLIQTLLPSNLIGVLIGAVLAWPLVAARSLHSHVADVALPLEAQDLDGARDAVSMIVGRDPATLDQAGIARAATESLAENASDGVIAPLFWGLLLGLPGIAAYKAINTLDSMIGHKNERFEAFGKAAAKLDDLANWIPARLTGGLFALAAGREAGHVFAKMRSDAPNHRSPNAGWPEAAMAAALDIRLSGPRRYGDEATDDPWLNEGAPDPTPADIRRGLSHYWVAILIWAGLLGLLTLI